MFEKQFFGKGPVCVILGAYASANIPYVWRTVLKELVEFIAKSLVDNPDLVEVTEVPGRTSVIIELKVAPEDMGRVIGKDGRVANALRTLLKVMAAREGKRVTLEII